MLKLNTLLIMISLRFWSVAQEELNKKDKEKHLD